MADWRKINRVLHRDLGYFFFGMTVIYAISGVLLNHIRDWNSSYDIVLDPVTLQPPEDDRVSDAQALDLLHQAGTDAKLKSHYSPAPGRLKIFFEDGSLELDTKTGAGTIERLEKRPVLFELNFMHYNPGKIWTVFSDIFCLALLTVAVTGLFVLKGKKGIKGRGAWLCTAGVIVPLVLLLLYL